MPYLPEWRLGALLRAAGHRLRESGPREFFRHSLRRLGAVSRIGKQPATDDFDQQFGTDTAGVMPLWRLDIASPFKQHGVRYRAIDAATVRIAIERLQIDPAGFTFLDLGSGKGRA